MSNLKRIREENGLSQGKLATAAGIGLKSLQFYEQGLRDINKAQALTIYRLARALGCQMEDLIEPPE